MNPNPDISNLKPFKKGQSGNPEGRPKMPNISEALAKIMAEDVGGIPALDAILKALRLKAVKGDVRAAQELMDRSYGKAKQYIENSGEMVILSAEDRDKRIDELKRKLAAEE